MNDERRPRYGERPVWWLDILSPTEAEMGVLTQAFGLHPLTSEDIMHQEDREKVELFRNYYFVTYRTFDQDKSSENYLQPFNMYAVVFREGVITFHFSMTPHPSNVRRRIRQLRDYMIMTADWISYAIIDDITDTFVPIIKSIERDTQDIEDTILRMLSRGSGFAKGEQEEKDSNKGPEVLIRVHNCLTGVQNSFDMLKHKADVIKGFAKKCNERWEVAPSSEIGLYLGDITDHIVTMVFNLEQLQRRLAEARSNCLASINLKMNRKAETAADGLNKLTVLGTIVLPMNIITGLWGMNVWVPGQEYEGNLSWFFWICFGLSMFGVVSFLAARKIYKV
jgi:magnesium transporter